jgi:hypothetical protein
VVDSLAHNQKVEGSIPSPATNIMYIPSKHFENPEQEVTCLLTGESYVYLEGDDLSLIEPKYHDGAIEELPKRFFQHPTAITKGNGQFRILMPKPQ